MLLDFAREHGGFGDVLQAFAGGGGAATEEAAAVVRGDVFARDFALADEFIRRCAPHPVAGLGAALGRSTTLRVIVLAKRAVPPPSEAEHLRIRVFPQFSTMVCASAWP
jgi:hypothetical protein